MIVRSGFKCLTCDQPHTVRIGMGQEARHIHRFPCEQCGEDLVVALCVDYENLSHWVEPVENAEWIEEIPGAPIVNLDANFIVPIEQRNKDFAFPRLGQMEKSPKRTALSSASVSTISEARSGRSGPTAVLISKRNGSF